MKLWLFSVLFATTIIAQAAALECFICADCANPFDRAAHEPQECTIDNLFPENETPTTTVVPEPDTTTEPPTTVTPPATTAPPLTTISTTPSTTAPPSTTTSTTPSTTESSSSVTTPSPSPDIPDTTTPSTLPPSVSTDSTPPSIPPSVSTDSTPATPPETTGNPITPAVLRRFRRQAANPEFRCFVSTFETNQTRRGCTRWLAGETATCTAIGGEHCKTCNEHGCNSATSLATSLAAILVAAFVALKML